MTAPQSWAEMKTALQAKDARIAEHEAALQAGLAELPSRPPAAPLFPDGHVTVSHQRSRIVLPTADELSRLEEIVYRAYPRLKAGGDPDSFRAAFFRLTYTRRAEKPDTRRSLDWWLDQAESWLTAQNYYPSRPSKQSFVAACVAAGDIAFTDPSRFPSMMLGITAVPQLEALPGRWRQVLESNQAPPPVPQR